MIVVHRMLAETSRRPASEQVVLMVERRLFLKRRWRGIAEDGCEFGFDLESRLQHGGVIHRSDSADYVVRQAPETVYQLQPSDAAQAALMGWKIGNLHLGIEVSDGLIRAVRDPAVQQLCEREGWPLQETTVVFNPLRVTAHVP